VAQTPAPPKERIKGSKVNPVGSASSEEKAKGIKLSENIVESLKSKVAKFKKENPKKKNVTLDDAKAVMRRGMGAYSTSHRPTITGGKPNSRTAWGFARVNKFLKKAGGEKVKKAYVQDDDLLKMEDGGTTLLAPNGRRSNLTPEQYKLVRTPEFKAWFGDWENDPENASKVVDDNGEPLVVYHGSENIFYEFLNKNSRIVGFYFSDSLFNAKSYGDNIFKVFLSIKHPFILNHNGKKFSDDLQIDVLAQYPDEKPYTAQVSVDIDEVVYMVKYGKRKNSFISVYNHKEYDGVIIKNIIDPALTSGNKILQTTYVSLESNQIKLSDGTNTTFDGSNPDIRYEDGGEVGSFYKWFINWYKGVKDEITMMISVPNQLRPFKEKGSVILEVFEKKNLSVDAKEYLKEILKKADEYGVTIILEPTPRYHKIKDKNHKENITREYLINYYEKFGFESTENHMVRYPKTEMKRGGEIITCENCGWSWKESQTTKKDKYICHKCGFDNKKVQNGYKRGGQINCYDYVVSTHSVKENGYYLQLSEISSLIDPYSQIPKNLSGVMITFNSGVKKDLSVEDTINSIGLVSKLSEHLNISKDSAIVVIGLYKKMAKKINQTTNLKDQSLIVIDRDMIVCSDIKNYKSGGETSKGVKSSVETMGNIDNDPLDSSQDPVGDGEGVFKEGGMLTDEDKKETYSKWKELINMSKSELKKFYDSKEGKEAGITVETASKLGISRGRTSAKWIMKMKDTPVAKWTPEMWEWANKQISFVSRMRGNKGELYDEKGNKTRKHTSLLIWGHNPEKYKTGGELNLEGYYEKGGDLISDLQNIDVSENIIELEEDWSGGVANFGDRSAAFKITKLPEYQDYKNNIENIIKSKYGKLIRVYRLMNQEQFDDWKSGNDIGYVSVSVDKKQAELFKKTPYYLNKKTKLVDFYAPVESVVMRGNTDEKELVLDSSYINMGSYGKGNEYDPQNPNIMYSKGGKLNLEGYYEKGGEGKTCEVIRNGVRQIDSKSIERLTDCVMKLPQTKQFNTDEKGEYTPERKKLHKKIIYDIKKDLTCVQRKEPIAILMGGSPASGKSTFLKKYRPYLLSEEILKVDADEVRSKLPEYKGWNATQTHLETKDIVNLLLSDRNIGIPCAFDLIYDGTMNSTKSYIPLINLLKSLGYKVFIVYIDNVDQDIIKQRALKRYQNSGRFVPLEVIDDFFTKGTAALESLKKKVDGYMVVDGSTSDYKVIERGGMQLPKDRNYSKIGTPIEVTEEEVVREYKKGGQTDFDPDSKNLKGMITHKSGSAGGMLVGKRHSEGGIKAINKSTGQPLEMEGGEVVITRDAVSDDTKREFEGQMMTNREILSKINESGGGVSFADGGDIEECGCTGKKFNYGGKTMTDYEIVNQMKSLYPKDFEKGKKEEMSEHKGTFEKLRRKGLTASQAADLVVAEHLKKKPDYYKNYKEGGVLDVLGKKIPSMPSFIEVGEPVMTPFKGLMNYFYQVKDSLSKKMVYREGGHIRGRKISDLLAYKTYIYDNFGINFSELPVRLQNALTLGNQKMIDDYLKE
jgi:predicted ABC-type ATPase